MSSANSTPNHIKKDTQLKALKPKKDRYEVADEDCRGLRIRILPTGKKNFVWYAHSQGKRHIVAIGTYRYVSLADARKKPAIISSLQVGSVVQHIVIKAYPSRAETVLSRLKQLFIFTIDRGFSTQSPAFALKKKSCGAKTEAGERVLNKADIHAFWCSLDEAPTMSAPVHTGLRVLLLSGVRSGELRLAQWKNVDFNNIEWSIPAENSKTIAWKVPLSSHIIKHFRKLEEYADDSPYIIAGKCGAVADKVFDHEMTHLFEIKDKKRKNILNIEQASPHDLRRTMQSKLDDLDIEPHISEKCLNHCHGKIEKTYNKNQLLKQRCIALEKWGDDIDLLVMPRENTTVLSA